MDKNNSLINFMELVIYQLHRKRRKDSAKSLLDLLINQDSSTDQDLYN